MGKPLVETPAHTHTPPLGGKPLVALQSIVESTRFRSRGPALGAAFRDRSRVASLGSCCSWNGIEVRDGTAVRAHLFYSDEISLTSSARYSSSRTSKSRSTVGRPRNPGGGRTCFRRSRIERGRYFFFPMLTCPGTLPCERALLGESWTNLQPCTTNF